MSRGQTWILLGASGVVFALVIVGILLNTRGMTWGILLILAGWVVGGNIWPLQIYWGAKRQWKELTAFPSPDALRRYAEQASIRVASRL